MKSSMGTVPAPPSLQSTPRPARRSEWLRSALAHHHSPDPGVDNEILVLAIGVDQYLQEVFHHLVYPGQDDVISAEDFTSLCSVLGLTGEDGETDVMDGEEVGGDEEGRGICSGLPRELPFRDFHSRLCGYFRVRARDRTGAGVTRLPVTEETELVEREIRVRWPRARRRKCVSFDLTRNHIGGRPAAPKGLNRPAKRHNETGQTEAECVALRELVEDLRSALQGSDARCLALEVALRRHRCTMHPLNVTTADNLTSSNNLTQNPQKRRSGVGKENVSGKVGSRDPIIRELQLIRSSRDGQLDEAIRFNQRLEQELGWAYGEIQRLERVESHLQKENNEIRWRAKQARNALREGLQKVRLIQEQAQKVPTLQNRITQLETEVEEYRSGCTCRRSLASPPVPVDYTCLQRAVEGRAASDEEEEDRENEEVKVREDGQCCLLEVKQLINRLHNCGKCCQHTTDQHLLLSHRLYHDKHNHLHGDDLQTSPRGWGHRGHTNQEDTELEKEVEMLRFQVQSLEGERAHQSLLEDKLTDALTLLQQLRLKGISRRALGKMLTDTLDECSRSGPGSSYVMQVVTTLWTHLSSSDLLGDGGGGPGAAPRSQRTFSVTNPLLISC